MGCGSQPETDEQRYVEIEPTGAGMAGIWANIHAPDAAALDQRLAGCAGGQRVPG